MASKTVKSETKDFLLAEYQLLKEMRDRVITRGEERIRFYFSLLSGSGALIAFFPQFFSVSQGFYIIILLVLSALLVFGILTLERLVSGHIAARIYARGINRIRRYFVDNDSSITKHLILPFTDDTPELGVIGFNEKKGASTGNFSMMLYMNTILVAVMGVIILTQFIQVQFLYTLIIIVTLCLFSVLLHLRYYASQIQKIGKKITVNFPKELSSIKRKQNSEKLS